MLLLTLLLPTILASDKPDAAAVIRLDNTRVTARQIDQYIEQAVAKAHVTGLAVSVVQNGQIRYLKTFGYADAASKRVLTPDTVMYGASFTKAIFGYLVVQLAEEGKLDLNRPISDYLKKPLPEYPKYADLATDARWKLITPRILLSHTAGFANYAFLEPDRKMRLHFQPGTRYAYSGEGINLLQFVLADMGIDVGNEFHTRVFDRFGMKRTGIIWRDDFASDLAFGHDESGKNLGHSRRSGVRASGSMDTTLNDMTRFAQLAVSKRQGLAPKSWNALFHPVIRIRTATQFPSLNETETNRYDGIQLSYGLGWGVFQTPHGRAVFKEGHDDGWENHVVCFDKRRTCMVLMSNSSNGGKTFRELLEFVIGNKYTPWEWEGYE